MATDKRGGGRLKDAAAEMTDTATSEATPKKRRRTPPSQLGRTSVPISDDLYKPLKALAECQNRSVRDLLEEAVALLLVEESPDEVPSHLRRKLRDHFPAGR